MKYKLLFLFLLASLIFSACASQTVRQTAEPTPDAEVTQAATQSQPAATAEVEATTVPILTEIQPAAVVQPVAITGSFTFTNDIIITYYVEHAVALVDLYGYVIRDKEWEIPVSSQTLGYLDLDTEKMTGSYTLQLPARPTGVTVDVNPDGNDETGVQVFSVGYFPNLTGGPYSEGDDPSTGWLSYLASTKNDSENNEEIIGGKIVIWAPDGEQYFPSDYGPDGLLFTNDDPVMQVPQGYSVVDLDQQPFQLIRDEEPELTLYEPDDAAVKDFSALSYEEAFDRMFEIARKEYAFNGIKGKQPDWDALYAILSPRIREASQTQNADAYFRALRDFTRAFSDGHVGLNGGEIANRIVAEEISGGFGFAIRELDDGRVITTFILQNGPASQAGMQVGAEIREFNGTPIRQAIGEVVPATAPHSTDFSLRFHQARFLLRAPIGTKATVNFSNRGESSRTVEMTAVQEGQSLSASSSFRGYDPDALPVEYVVATDRIGYVRLNSNYDDLNLIIRLFQRALQIFENNNLDTLIIDLRQNSGGSPLGLAGFLTDQEIVMGQLQYYSDRTGQFEAKRPPDTVKPYQSQFRFNKMFLLVDQGCASACELEAYGFSQVPGMVVVGQYPTAGVEAEVARGQFKLPEEMSMQIPTGRFVLPDGSIFLEGVGVQPTERIAITEDMVLLDNDPIISRVLQLAR
jgi:C-terminal processing protease CtpA/Prc